MKKSKSLMSLFLTACMLISLSAPAFAADSEVETETAVLKLGDYIQMGTYGGEPVTWRVMAFEKISETNEDGIPVIDSTDIVYEYAEGYLPLLMTDKIITMKSFDAGYDPDATPSETSSHSKMMDGDAVRNSGSNYWGDSNIRCWLNSDAAAGEVEWTCGFAPVQEYMWLEANGYADEAGFLNSFNAAERKAIVSTSQKTLIDSLYDGTIEEEYAPFDMPTDVYSISKFYELYQYEYNTDTVFLPDMIQIYNIAMAANFLGGSAYLTSPTDYAEQQIPNGSDYSYMTEYTGYYPYWLRTPQEGSGYCTGAIIPPYLAELSDDAMTDEIQVSMDCASDMGVRPACYIDMAALDMTSSSGTEDSPYTVALPEYTVTYDAAHNGGALYGEDTISGSVIEGTDIIPGNDNVCEKEGYTFVGWNTDPDAHEALTSYEVTGDVTLYAIYVKNVMVNFYTLDSTSMKRESINIYNNTTSGTVTFPDEDNTDEWTFIGWTSAKDSSEAEYKANSTVEISENTDYFAVYSREITITFMVNDESGTEFLPVETQTYTQYMNGSGVTFPVDVTVPSAPQRTGYYFTGWRSQDNYQNLVSADGTISVNESTSFAAEWELAPPEEFKVTYDYATNGGSSASEQEQTVIDNSPADLTPTAVKSGYEFVGWNTDPDAEEALTSYEVNGDVTLYAIFVKTVTANFYTADSTSLKRESINIYNNNTSGTVTFPDGDVTDEWTFIGWTSAKDSSEAEYKANGTVEISENTDYFAVYSHEITMTFMVNDESGTELQPAETQTYDQYMNSGGVTFPVEITAPSAPERKGYYFTGWRSQDNYQNLVQADETISVSESTSFEAEWEQMPPEEVKVTYDYRTNGGSSASAQEQTVKYNSPADLTPTAVKSGYEFVGWNTDPDALEALEEYAVLEDTTLYAIFKKTVSLRFYSRNGMIQTTIPADLYNNETTGVVILPQISSYKDWEPLGWRNDSTAAEPEIYGEEMEFSEEKTNFYAVYSKDITLSYDTDGGSEIKGETKQQYYNAAGNISEVEFTLADAPSKDTDVFVSWAIGSKNGEKHQPGDVIKSSENITAYAVWESDTVVTYTVTYDYSANGGSSITAATASVSVNSGDKADLSVDAYKDTYEFVGWNTDKNATEGMTQYIVTEDVTLYAIFKKTVMAQFMNEANDVQSVQYAVLYNNDDTAIVTAPEPLPKDGWETDGWRSDTEAAPASYKSGAVRIGEDTYFYPVYKRFITLSYDINSGNGPIRPDTSLQYINGFGNTQEVSFTLAAAPQRSGYSFTGWTVDADPTRGYQSGEIIKLTGNAVATAMWSEIQTPADSVSVTYDYASNGGSRTTKAYDTLVSGDKADLTPTAVKAGYEFVGWNTDKNAQTALAEYTVTDNTTLYAIYKKDITARFYSGENVLQDTVSRTLWNNEREAVVTAPEPYPLEGWTAVGWRDNKHALENEYQSGEIRISDDTDFYAIYSRDITVSETAADGESTTTVSFNQYYNACGGAQSRTVMLEEPEPREGYRFRGWQVGDDTSKRYKPGTPVTVSESTSIVGLWVQLPEGDVKLPSVQTGDASVASSTSAAISAKVESDGGSEVIERGFVYWSKLNSGSKYTVLTNADEACALSNLSPDTEYYYYAFAENAAGTGKGYIRSFATASDDKPNALMITPEYVSIEKDSVYQLLATLLPASAKNRAIVWSSSDEQVAKVDSEGKVTGLKEGQAVITATTEVDRLSAECIVEVTETEEIREYNFSEWNMATNTSSFAEDGLGFDWDTTNYGGNHQIATAYLARWDGAVLEENDPYPAFNNNPASSYKKTGADYHIQNVEWLPAREGPLDNDEIKSALMEYGAVYTLFNIDWKYFDSAMLNYYSPTELSSGGHCVTIVGWDDNYSKSNFVYQPPGNGAFLCKNSWGEYAGDGGYFYISYYDAQMGRMDSNAVVTGMEKNSNYNKIYQYDPLGAVGYIGWYDTTYAANVFPENGKTLEQDEELKAVSFYTYHKNTSYDVYIVTDYKDSASLSKLWTPSASGVIENSGYHTVNLNTSVSLKAGTRFAVVVKLDTPGECSYVYCEYPVYGYSSNARANADESYYGPDGEEWYDLTYDVDNANFCIKAFTDNGLALSSEQLFSGIDNAEREYESDTVYTLSQAAENGLPVNDAYIDYLERIEREADQMSVMSDNEKAMGSVPSITKAGANSVTFTDGAVFPSSYDLREMGLVSPVRDQGQWGTCWAHTMYASLESNLLRSMKTTAADSSGTVPTDMLLSRDELTMAPGASITLAKKITPVSAADKAVVWVSSDESVATVDTNGTIRAVGGGLANITAVTVSGGICSQCSVVVEEQGLEEVVSFEEKRVNKSVSDVFMVAYSVTPMKSEASAFGWISDNTNAAVVNENGVITAVAEGTAEISIISDKGEIKDSVTVVVGGGFNCDISDVDDSGLTLSDNVLSGDVTVTINNKAASDTSAAVTLAVYDSNNLMTGVISASKLLSSGENQIAFSDIAIDGIQTGSYTLKCFVWDSFAGASPLSAAAYKQLTIN